MGFTSIVLGLIIAAAVIIGSFRLPGSTLKVAGILAGALIILIGVVFSSVRFVGTSQIGIIKKNALGGSLTGGKIIATDGEKGIQADVLPPGWHFGFWPVIYDIDLTPLVEIKAGEVGIVEARDGLPLDPGQVFAPEVPPSEFKKMVEDASYFLGAGQGRKGPQSNVLTPGNYRLNTELFNVRTVAATAVPEASVAVLKANFGDPPTIQRVVSENEPPIMLAGPNERGVRAETLPPGTYPLNPEAYTVSIVSNEVRILYFTAGRAAQATDEQREITVRTSDGFTFPVDVRVEYEITPAFAPIVIAKLGDDREKVVNPLNSSVRAIFRNNAEDVKALDYVQQRSLQERQSLEMLTSEMQSRGVNIVAVRIGDVGTNDPDLAPLLKTQTDREIAVQEQLTFQEQQKAAEQRKELTRTEQEAEEERRLATARYEVDIARETQQRRIIEAEAAAKAIEIEAEAQATAYSLIAQQVGSGNAALIELLKIVGENAIQITPRVMVTGGMSQESASAAAGAETVALIGTMLDTMISREPIDTRPVNRTGDAAADRSGDQAAAGGR